MDDDAPRPRPLELVSAVLGLVSALHAAGYQLIRVWPGMAPSGMHWRCAVSTADNVDLSSEVQGFSDWAEDRLFPYSSGMGLVPYDAEGFLEAFPVIAERGLGEDPAYAAWLAGLMAKVGEGFVPVGYADYPMPEGTITLLPFAKGLEEEAYPLAPLPSA